MEIMYGKRIVSDSYFNGQLKSKKVTYSIPIVISDKAEALTEIMKAIELLVGQQTCELGIVIKTDPKTHQFKMITKNYTTEE